MKNIVIGFLLTCLAIPAFAQTYTSSCSHLIEKKAKYAAELDYLRSKMRQTRNADNMELYMDQYEEIYARYQEMEASISDRCR